MPMSSSVARGNELFDSIFSLTVTPPATITTATTTSQTYTFSGLAIGDVISWNQTTFASALVTITNMYASAANTLTIIFTTEGATVSGAAAISFLLTITRPENYVDGGLISLPTAIV